MKHTLVRLWKRIAAALMIAVGALYLGDYVSVRYRIPGNREQFANIQVQRFYAVQLKGRKTEYMYDEPETRKCVNSLFPHLGATPCWYAVRHKYERIDVNSGPPSALF